MQYVEVEFNDAIYDVTYAIRSDSFGHAFGTKHESWPELVKVELYCGDVVDFTVNCYKNKEFLTVVEKAIERHYANLGGIYD